MMKRLSMYIVMLIMGMSAFTLTGCSEDQLIGMTLEGTWRGDMNVYHSYGGQRYEAVWSEICFSADPFRTTRGTGYWCDEYSSSPWGRNYVANHITWRVENRIIYIHFVEDNYDIQIHVSDNYLSNNRFIGTIWTGSERIEFNLYHVDSPNWESYHYGWDYYAKGENGKGAQFAPPVRHFGKQE